MKNIRAMAAALMMGLGFTGIADMFAGAALAPNRWQGGSPAKRARIGSYRKPNPEGFAAKKKTATGRLRYLRLAPSWSNPDRLAARGMIPSSDQMGLIAGHFELPRESSGSVYGYFDHRGVIEDVKTEARPYGSKAANIARFANTKGNHGGTISKRIRRDFFSGDPRKAARAVANARRYGVII